MAWNDGYKYMRGVAGKHGVGATSEQDVGLPLGARIGGLISIQQSPFIRASAAGSLIGMPGEGDTRIVAVSQMKLSMAGTLYRYYLATGDVNARERFVQVFKDGQGRVAELMYCTQLARTVPETAEDQDAYTGQSGVGLGDVSYTLWREQLADVGLDEAQLAQIFGDGDRLDYRRDAGDPGSPYLAPFSGNETRLDDAGGVKGLQQDIYFMPYVRDLPGGGSEYLLITTEIIASVNGDASQRGIHVDFVIGIPLEQERVVIQ